MQIEFDPAKDASNHAMPCHAKHGVSLAMADAFEWDDAVVWPDVRRSYSEDRLVGLGYIGMRLFNVVFVERAGLRRIISLRKANAREEKRYAKT